MMLFFSVAIYFTWKKGGEEASLEGLQDALWPEGSASPPGLGGLSGRCFSWGPAEQPAPQPCRRPRGGSVGGSGVKDRAVLAVGWCGCVFMVPALWWQCSPLHPWLLVLASRTERTSPRGDELRVGLCTKRVCI